MKNRKMKIRKIKGHKTYYRRILLVMFLFILAVMLPFFILLYHGAKKNMINTINQSNASVMNQMKFNYEYFSENIASLCLSTFFRRDIKMLMYGESVDSNELYVTVKDLRDNILQTQPSLQSIVIYNAQRGEWYSTDMENTFLKDDLQRYLAEQEDVQKLKPLLRKVRVSEAQEAYSYVFSYFMYEYSSPVASSDSYLVLNQSADWFVDNITNARAKSTASVYLVDRRGEICNYKEMEIPRVHEELIGDCSGRRGRSSGEKGFFVENKEAGRFLISYMELGSNGDCIVMIQDYEEIFADLIRMKNDFILWSCVCASVSVVLIILLSRFIYRPVDTMMDFVSNMDMEDGESAGIFSRENDEFEHLRSTFRKISTVNKELLEERKSSFNVIHRYILINLLGDSTEESWEQYYKGLPESPLSLCEEYHLAVVIIHVVSWEKTEGGFGEQDISLILWSVNNILEELLGQRYTADMVRMEKEEMVYVVNIQDHELGEGDLKECLKQLWRFVKEYTGIRLSIACSRADTQQSRLSDLYEEARNYSRYRVLKEDSILLDSGECFGNVHNCAVSCPRELRKKLEERLKMGSLEQAREVLMDIKKNIRGFSYDNMTISLMSLLTGINMVVNEINMARSSPVVIRFDEMYRKVLNIQSLDGLFEDIVEYVSDIFTDTYEKKEKEADKDQLFVRTVVDFVARHYSDTNLSSQMIADHMDMSCRYLMKKFKLCTDVTLNEYILKIRMKYAVELLVDTDMPINRITEMVGIENENYFYRLFKKVYGCTPREFAERRGDTDTANKFC